MPEDHFAQLGQPRRPWLAEEELKAAFHRLSAEAHPDRAGGDGHQAAARNAAYSVLRDPAQRLRHLLELAAPDALAERAGAIPPELADRFMRLAGLRRSLEAYFARAGQADGPLAKAMLLAEHATLQGQVAAELADLQTAEQRAQTRVQALDAAWISGAEDPAGAAALASELAYYAKWQAQLREAAFRLSV